MPRCPKCGKKIDYLVYWELNWDAYRFDGEVGNLIDSRPGPEDRTIFECPECGEELFTDIEEATEFLKKEKADLSASPQHKGAT